MCVQSLYFCESFRDAVLIQLMLYEYLQTRLYSASKLFSKSVILPRHDWNKLNYYKFDWPLGPEKPFRSCRPCRNEGVHRLLFQHHVHYITNTQCLSYYFTATCMTDDPRISDFLKGRLEAEGEMANSSSNNMGNCLCRLVFG